MAYDHTEPVEFDPANQEEIKIFAGVDDDNVPFVQLTFGDKAHYLPCSIALHVGLTLQQLAYTSMFLSQAHEVALEGGYVDMDALPQFSDDLVKAIMGSGEETIEPN
jgi:hypothetical protein